MKRLIKLILCTVLIISMTTINVYGADNIKTDEKITKTQAKEDIEFMMETLESVHPDLYFAVSKEDIDRLINDELKDIDGLITSIKFYKKFSPIINSFKDGHTGMRLPNDYITKIKNNDEILFINVHIKDGKIHIYDTFIDQYEKYKGWEIQSINGKKASKIYDEMLGYVSGSKLGFKESSIENNFVLYYYLNNEPKDEYMINVKNGDKKEIIKIQGISLEEAQKLNDKEEKKQDYIYEKLNNNTGLITFNSFSNFEKFEEFLAETFEEINKEKLDNLIIDLRKNGGGNSRLGDLLIEYIYDGKYTQANSMDVKISDQIIEHYTNLMRETNEDKEEIEKLKSEYMKYKGECYTYKGQPSRKFLDNPKFQGDVYFLIGRRTFSSAVMLASTVKDYNIGYLIGEETGGIASHYGDLYQFGLPNTHLKIFVSHKYFTRPNGLDTGRGVLPDYDINDLGKRDALEIALEIINNKHGK